MRSTITKIANYLPSTVVTSTQIEEIVRNQGINIPRNILEQKFGISERRYADSNTQASDLAVGAAKKILQNIDKTTVDCLIFAAGSSDLIEPATANIVQAKLKLFCPTFDVKNACNSFVNALQLADSLIKSGQYRKILIATGEKLSSIIKLDLEDKKDLANRFACLSMGDGGAAALIESSNDECGIYAQLFESHGEHWELCTVPGGGSMHPHDGTKVYFEGKTKELRDIFLVKKDRIVERCLDQAKWQIEDIDHFFMHHVSESTFDLVAKSMNIKTHKFYNVIKKHGNMASASIPFAMSDAVDSGLLKKGDKIMLIGLAAGISISIQLMIW
jgi:3-oxoacyl-[acyl-carrier-protein] synthase-3